MNNAYRKEEMRDIFLDAVKCYVNYWNNLDIPSNEKLEGLVFGIMSIIDGTSGAMPCSIDLVLRPHPDDKQYYIENDEKWIKDGMCINDDVMLHEYLK